MSVKIKLEGDEELLKKLSAIPKKTIAVLGKSVRAAAKPILKAARAGAPVQSGTLKKSLGVKVKKYKKNNATAAIIGPKKGFSGDYEGEKRVPANYAHLVHDGFTDKKGVFHPGTPFIKAAYEQEKHKAEGLIKDKIRAEVEKEAKK